MSLEICLPRNLHLHLLKQNLKKLLLRNQFLLQLLPLNQRTCLLPR